MMRERALLSRCAIFLCMGCLIACAVLAFFSSHAVAQETSLANFSIVGVSNFLSSDNETLKKGCYNQTLTSATITIGAINLLTSGSFQNMSTTTDAALRLRLLSHDVLTFSAYDLGGIPDLSPATMPNQQGQSLCTLNPDWPNTGETACAGGYGDYNANSFGFRLTPLEIQPLTAFATTGDQVVYNIPAGQLSLFQDSTGSDTFPVVLRAKAEQGIDRSGTFADSVSTVATGVVAIEYICQSPNLVCNHKLLDDTASLNLPAATSFPHDVTVKISFTNGPTAQVVSVVDTFPNSNWVYNGGLGGSGYFTSAPTPVGNQHTFVSNSAIPANATVEFYFTARLTNANAVTACPTYTINSVHMEGAVGGESDCSAQVCLQQEQRVPATNVYGTLILSLVMAGSAVWFLRRRRVS